MIGILLALALGGVEAPRLKRGTPLVLATVAPISSKAAVKGDRFELVLVEPVTDGGTVLAPAGARATGELTRVEAKGAFGAAGRLEARLLYLTVDGRAVRISGRLDDRRRAATGVAVATAAAVGALSFVVTGRSARIPAGTRVVAEVASDVGLAR